MAIVNEKNLINIIAKWERSIDGIKDSYDAYQNPTNITNAIAPCVLHYPPEFSSEPQAHFNRWNNSLTIRSTLLVLPRQSRGSNLSYLENEAMPFLFKWRQKFQSAEVIQDMLNSATGLTRVWLSSGQYGVGGNLLTIGTVEWIGCIFNFTFTEIA